MRIVQPIDSSQAATRQALLEAAAVVFAEHGFRAATVREICSRARANIAAINYHFGDKETLYLEVLRYTQEEAYKRFPSQPGLKPDATAQERLRAFIRSFLHRIFADGPAAWHGQIMSREMVEPTAALDHLVEERIRPQALQLHSIVRELLGPGANAEQIRLCGLSVVSQCLFYHHCRPVISRLFPTRDFSEDIDSIADHIADFSLAALEKMHRELRRK
jgi:TetR/AcrR family transcriptional regulator, regulator of cefoperazone and chloramphenicol sensitivity